MNTFNQSTHSVLSDRNIIVLAAGQGKRMHSTLPKVLQPLGGKPLLLHVLHTIFKMHSGIAPIVVYGHQGDRIREACQTYVMQSIRWVEQKEQRGTAHAILQAVPHLDPTKNVLILYGDVPLISQELLEQLIQETPPNAIGLITADLPNPTGFGRILRNSEGQIIKIIEEKEATPKERTIKEINSGIYCIPADYLIQVIPTLQNNNHQSEFYLTDIIARAAEDHRSIYSLQTTQPDDILGINDCEQLAHLERIYQKKQAQYWLNQGVRFSDLNRVDMRGNIIIGKETWIDINVILEGTVHIGGRCKIGAHCILRNVTLENDIDIQPYSIVENSLLHHHAKIGPFARIRPGTTIESNAHIGNFTEIKNSRIGANSKINHMSYIGDTNIGTHVNIGAGTVTCNYNGYEKNKTIIEAFSFIGSNTTLIAPLTIGHHAYIGAGSVITRYAPPGELTLSRQSQRTLPGWLEKQQQKGII